MNPDVYTGGFVQTNAYLLNGPEGALLIDAPAGVTAWLKAKGITPAAVLLTHQHYDHVEDAAALQEMSIPLHSFAAYSKDLTLESVTRGWGMPISVVPYRVDQLFDLTQPLVIAGRHLQLAHIPGHSTDSITFYLPDIGLVFSGDTLFAESIGRSDLPGGSSLQLVQGIEKNLLSLPDQTKVYPGHGPATTIGHERLNNPYLE
jgi:hydroxyacylglutathione hydrolase